MHATALATVADKQFYSLLVGRVHIDLLGRCSCPYLGMLKRNPYIQLGLGWPVGYICNPEIFEESPNIHCRVG